MGGCITQGGRPSSFSAQCLFDFLSMIRVGEVGGLLEAGVGWLSQCWSKCRNSQGEEVGYTCYQLEVLIMTSSSMVDYNLDLWLDEKLVELEPMRMKSSP